MDIATVIEQGRKNFRMSRVELGRRTGYSPRTIESIERGEQQPTPEGTLAISKELEIPWLTQLYCRQHCAIGHAYSYDVLVGVNLDPPSVLMKLISEMEEARQVMMRLQELLVNKNSREDFSATEWVEFSKCIQQLLDVEHNIEVLKITLGYWFDVSEMVRTHNVKCQQKGYTNEKVAASARRTATVR
ncbi:MAG: helix-turn-helix domain-containing protein [Bacillota bacterium]